MNFLKEATLSTPTFKPRWGRMYYCDNYTLVLSTVTAKWSIFLYDKLSPVITEDHPEWKEYIACFEWTPFIIEDTIEIEDGVEQMEQQLHNLDSWIDAGYLSPLNKDVDRARRRLMGELGIYAEYQTA